MTNETCLVPKHDRTSYQNADNLRSTRKRKVLSSRTMPTQRQSQRLSTDPRVNDIVDKLVVSQASALIQDDSSALDTFVHETVPSCLATVLSLPRVNGSSVQQQQQQQQRKDCVALASLRLLQPCGSLKTAVHLAQTRTTESEVDLLPDVLKVLRLQAMLRLKLLEILGADTFLVEYAGWVVRHKPRKTQRKSHRQPQTLPFDIFFCDLTGILSLAALCLHRSSSFPAFLESCLPRDLVTQKNAPTGRMPYRTMLQIFDFFEVSNPYQPPSCNDTKGVKNVDIRSPIRLRTKVTKPSVNRESGSTMAVATNGKRPNNALLAIPQQQPSWVQPIRHQPNSLLQNNVRSKFVGSHFNSKQHMATLFRNVKVAPAKVTAPLKSKVVAKSEPSTLPLLKITNTLPSKKSGLVRETPVKSRARVVSETPSKPALLRRRLIVAETPLAKSTSTSSAPLQVRFGTQSSWPSGEQQVHGKFQNSALVAAEAMRAVQRESGWKRYDTVALD